MSTPALRRLVAGERPSRYQQAFAGAVGDLLVQLDTRQTQVLLVTAPEAGAGTTFCTFGLAAGLSTHGLRVLLVDANIQHPTLTELLNLGDRPGLREYAKTGQLPTLTQPAAAFPALTVMGVGAVGSLTRSGIAGLDRFGATRGTFDFVLVDGPALNANFEAQILAEQAAHTLLVVGEGKTTLTATAQAKQILSDRKAPCLGVLMNRHRLPYPACLKWLVPV